MSFEMNFIGLALVRNVVNQKDSLCHNNIFFLFRSTILELLMIHAQLCTTELMHSQRLVIFKFKQIHFLYWIHKFSFFSFIIQNNAKVKYNFLIWPLSKKVLTSRPLVKSINKLRILNRENIVLFQNRNPTIKAIRQGACQLGQRDGFSATDLQKINKLYSCKGTTAGTVNPTPTTTPKPSTGVCNDTHM